MAWLTKRDLQKTAPETPRLSPAALNALLKIGNKVSYPGQGPCLIGAVVKREVNRESMAFYQLVLLDDRGGELLIPVEKIKLVGVRPLVSKTEVPALLNFLAAAAAEESEQSRLRNRDDLEKINDGSAFSLAETVRSLTSLGASRPLSFGMQNALDKARRLLICELSAVLGRTKRDASAMLDKALQGPSVQARAGGAGR